MPEKNEDNPVEENKDLHPENNQDLKLPDPDTTSIEQIQEKENMEVHHHTHTTHGKKSWKNYFWEFLMLFLAVFCGFLAEYQLEHKIERDRANELAKSFYQELKNDSITVQSKVQNRLKSEAGLQYVINYFRDSSLTNNSKAFTLSFINGITFRSPYLFEPRTIILDQLRNSGSLRYFKNDEFQNLTGDLTVAIKNVYDRQDLESEIRLRYINPIIIGHYDYKFDAAFKKGFQNIFDAAKSYEKSDSIIPFQLSGVENFDREETVNVLSFYLVNVFSSTRQTQFQKYIEVNAALLKVLREDFDLE